MAGGAPPPVAAPAPGPPGWPDASASAAEVVDAPAANPRVLAEAARNWAINAITSTRAASPLGLTWHVAPAPDSLAQYGLAAALPTDPDKRAVILRNLQTPLAIPGRTLRESSTLAEINFPRLLAGVMRPATTLRDLILGGDFLPPTPGQMAGYLGLLGYPSTEAVLRGGFELFGAWVLDSLVAAMALEVGLRTLRLAQEGVRVATFAVLGGLDPWPLAPDAPSRFTRGHATAMAHLIQTYAGVLAFSGSWEQLRRLGVSLLLIEHYALFPSPSPRRALVSALRYYRRLAGARPSDLSARLPNPST